ncbi:Na/Pi cotransporter family protein [Pokkaliibacter sp. CJK22405]|uniref:Na/Pi cotransporter family protein n=1 Tax=Pokkaliibacter sp. CJK22405 TaxID=3384615 RepID=UPI003984EB32
MSELIHLAGAIALLLWGIRMVRTGFERAYGRRLETAVRILTRRRPMALALGAGAAAALQSSTAVILLAAGFVSTGALGLLPALALAIGADIGSSLVALLLSLDLSLLSPALLLVGYFCFGHARHRLMKYWGRIALGLGMLLLALKLVADTTSVMRSGDGMEILTSMLAHDTALTLFLIALFTWLVHSSLAVILIVAHLATDGAIPADMAMIMVLGANLGGALPAISAGWGIPRDGRLVILGNLTLRLGAVVTGFVLYILLQLPFVTQYVGELEHPVVFHVLLNLVNGAIMLFLLPKLIPFLQKLFPASAEHVPEHAQPMYLSRQDIQNPERALANVANEALRIADIAYQMLESAPKAFEDATLIVSIKELDDDIDRIHREATYYLAAIDDRERTEEERARWQHTFNFITNLEHVGDIIDNSLMVLARQKHKSSMKFSTSGREELESLFGDLFEIFRLSQAVFLSQNKQLAKELIDAKREFRGRIFSCREQHAKRLRQQVPESLQSSQIHMDILRDLQRISSYLVATAYHMVESGK